METFSPLLAFVWGIHWPPVNSQHKGQWRGALMFSLICAWINGWVNNREAGGLRRHRAHYDVTVMFKTNPSNWFEEWVTKTWLRGRISTMAVVRHMPCVMTWDCNATKTLNISGDWPVIMDSWVVEENYNTHSFITIPLWRFFWRHWTYKMRVVNILQLCCCGMCNILQR